MAEYASERDSDNLLSGNGDKNRTIGYQTVQVQRPAISKGPGMPAKKMARSPYLAVIDCMRAYIRRSQTKLLYTRGNIRPSRLTLLRGLGRFPADNRAFLNSRMPNIESVAEAKRHL